MGAEVNIEHVNGCPALVNDADATAFAVEVARDLFGAEKVCADAAPVMGSEDFAFMLEQNPAAVICFSAPRRAGTLYGASSRLRF